jgi:hypothetical protein
VDRRWTFRLWVPDLSLLLAFATLVWALTGLDAWQNLFRDSDSGWHIRIGERIIDSRSLPRTDPFSFSRPGAPWMDWEWGADVLIGAAHRWMGLPGVVALFALTLAACTWLWVRLSWRAGGDFLLTLAFFFPMLATVRIHWFARPHVLGWLMLLGWIVWMESGGGPISLRFAAACALFAAVWANIHGSFLLGLVVTAIYGAGAGIKPLVWSGTGGSGASRWPWYAVAGACFAIGTIANPYGLALHAHVLEYLNDRDLLARVAEFQSFNFHSVGADWVQVAMGLCAIGAVAALGNRRPEHFLLPALLLSMSLHSARALPLLALCALPLANANIAGALGGVRGLTDPWRRRLNRMLALSPRLRSSDRRFAGVALVPITVVALVLVSQSPSVDEATDFPEDQFPVAAARRIEHLPAGARILAPDRYGGYLIYHFSGHRKVFVDGRSDFYGTEFMRDYFRLMETRPGWQEIAERYQFTHALVPVDSPLASALPAAGWPLIYVDATAALFAAPGV